MNAHSSERFRRENCTHGYRRQIRITSNHNDSDSYDEEENDENTSSDSSENQDVHEFFPRIPETYSPRVHKRYSKDSRKKTESLEFVKNHSSGYVRRKSQDEEKTWTSRRKEILFVILLTLVLICISTYLCFCFNESENEEESTSLRTSERQEALNKILDESMETVRRKFQNQRIHIWDDISSRLYDVILYPEKPAIIILFANETITMNCLALLLGELSGKILGSNDYLLLTPQDFPNDIGETVHNLQIRVSEKRAVVVQDLLNVNAQAIKAFHNLCDRENPLVNRTIYIITMVADGYEPWQRELEFVEKKLNDRLSREVEKDILYPLVTRITDGAIISIQPELTLSRCSFNVY